uniref:Uncharacterized protein n=1 Tax=Polytomella parva TaxID=51329 RepID=A0A7S0UTC1_9CHLO|mmetsp:Transcript_14080/g.24682  ORF Transcript_14080/g.24682 Transcript_14080/m.24682 type:complete len:278 (+) Transcript_14080:201-1034(+)
MSRVRRFSRDNIIVNSISKSINNCTSDSISDCKGRMDDHHSSNHHHSPNHQMLSKYDSGEKREGRSSPRGKTPSHSPLSAAANKKLCASSVGNQPLILRSYSESAASSVLFWSISSSNQSLTNNIMSNIRHKQGGALRGMISNKDALMEDSQSTYKYRELPYHHQHSFSNHHPVNHTPNPNPNPTPTPTPTPNPTPNPNPNHHHDLNHQSDNRSDAETSSAKNQLSSTMTSPLLSSNMLLDGAGKDPLNQMPRREARRVGAKEEEEEEEGMLIMAVS